MRRFILVVLACLIATTGAARAQTLNQEMAGLADKVSKALVSQGFKNVAAVDFTDLQGQPTELGRYLSERIAVEIVSAGGVSMVDRANIKSILAEHKLTEEGLVNPANAKKLGEFAGVDAILIGNVTTLDGIELMVKAISTDSAKIVAAGRITFPKTSDIQQLLNRGISARPAALASPTTADGGSGTSYREANNAIATKDIGALRIVLKSVSPLKLKDQNGRIVNGIRCSFDFIDRDTQQPLIVAANAAAPPPWDDRMGELLRSSLSDERGGVWQLSTSSVKGIGTVGVGYQAGGGGAGGRGVGGGRAGAGLPGLGGNGRPFEPSQIAVLLAERDTRNSDRGSANQLFVFGATTSIQPGQTASVTMDFVQQNGEATSGTSPRFFQMDGEIVVGVVTTDGKRSYSLHNLTFDRVGMPAF